MRNYLTTLQGTVLEIIKSLKIQLALQPLSKNCPLQRAIVAEISGFELVYRGLEVMLSGGDPSTVITGLNMVNAALDIYLSTAPEGTDLTPMWEVRAGNTALRKRFEQVNDILAEHEQLESELAGGDPVPKDHFN